MKKKKNTPQNTAELLPLLPLRNLVALPGMKMSLYIGRPKSITAVDKSFSGGRHIMLASQKSAKLNEPKEKDVWKTGCVAEVSQTQKLPDGTVRAVVNGLYRARISNFQDTGDLFMVIVNRIPDKDTGTGKTIALFRAAKTLLERYSRLKPSVPSEILQGILGLDDPSALADAVASQLFTGSERLQAALEAVSVADRLEMVLAKIQEEIEIQEIEKTVRGRVKKQMEKSQRDYYLNEQMKAIQRELGRPENDRTEFEEIARKIHEARMPGDIERKALKELARLEQMPPLSAEGTVVRNYLDWLIDVPWNYRTVDIDDVEAAQKILEEDHYGLDRVKERIVESLAVRSLVKDMKGPILCLVGPPGVGKTSLGRSVARAMGRKFVRFSLGGVRDEAEIRGHRRTYIGALPGKIIQGMKKAGTKNPVIMLDEVDKLSSDYRGDPSSALLEALDPEQNNSFNDHYLEVDYDLSEVMFITTANSLGPIPKPLRDRMEIISIPGYTDEEKIEIAKKFLAPRQTEKHGLGKGRLKFGKKTFWALVRNYTREAGVRELERVIAKICRKTARNITRNPKEKPAAKPAKTLSQETIIEFLGPSKYREELAEKSGGPGVATALAWTEVGGELLKIETIILEGKGIFILTGKLGDVMKESAQAALSYIRNRAPEFGLDREFYNKVDIHIHIPEGAIPKDGPSAGVALCLSMISALTGVPAKGDVAMTGEITLRGNIIKIGGLKEKLLAAHRAGIKKVLIPKENQRDLTEISKDILKKLTVIPVEHLDQAQKLAIESALGAGGPKQQNRKSGLAESGQVALN